MSEYTFKNLNEIDNVSEPADGTTVMGFENGIPIQMPMIAIKGSGGVFIIDQNDPEYSETDPAYGDKIKEALLSGKQVWFFENDMYIPVAVFNMSMRTMGSIALFLVPLYLFTTQGIQLNTSMTAAKFSITG